MAVRAVGVGAGARDPEGHANVLRLLVGPGGFETLAGARSSTTERGPLVLETNVDDLDPRLWPVVIAALLEAGASDAWLTPILMKKGRPAHTLSVLVAADRADVVRREVYRQTSTIGLREQRVGKHALDRAMATVEVDGHTIAVKVARLDGEVVNVQPEFEDVAAAASALGRPVKTVMAAGDRRRARGELGGPRLMDLAVIAIAFGAIFVVELPDKTFIAALVLSTRYKPLAVWIGVGLAFFVQTLIAVLAGHLATFLPDDADQVGGDGDLPGRRRRAVPLGARSRRGGEGDRGGVRRQGDRRPHRPAGRRWPRSWCSSPPSGATSRSC